MARIFTSLVILGTSATAASAHPGHGLEGFAHLLSHSFGGLFLLGIAGLLICAAVMKERR